MDGALTRASGIDGRRDAHALAERIGATRREVATAVTDPGIAAFGPGGRTP